MINLFKISNFTLIFVLAINLNAQEDGLKLLASWMSGSFSSQEQSIQDTNFYDIRLEMVRVWNNRNDAIWLYIEQADANSLDKPYRQRIYRITKSDDDIFESKVFEINNPEHFTGCWNDEILLSELNPDSLIERLGCSIFLTKINSETFLGSTKGTECVSNLRGATYATSEVTITENSLISWDRGFSKDDEQIWGAVKGGYIFKKIKNYPIE